MAVIARGFALETDERATVEERRLDFAADFIGDRLTRARANSKRLRNLRGARLWSKT